MNTKDYKKQRASDSMFGRPFSMPKAGAKQVKLHAKIQLQHDLNEDKHSLVIPQQGI